MQVSIETLEGLERRMTVQVPAETIAQAVEKKLRDLTKTVRIDGFRPGKVPLKVVQQKYGGPVRQEVIGDVIESSYREAITQEKVRPAGMPNIESIDSEGKEEISYTATFEVYPELDKIKLESIKIVKTLAEVTDADLEAMVQKLREQNKQWSEVKQAAKKGDQVIVDFEGRVDGELFEGGTGNDMPVEIGAGQMLEDFESGLEGISAGEEKVIQVKFPENYHGKEVAGKKAEFTIKATRVSKAQLPDIDEDFAKKFGIEDGDLDKFHADIRANMEKELSQRLKMENKNAVMMGLLEENQLIAPSALVAEEVKTLKMQAAERMGRDKASIDDSSLPDDLFKEEAQKRVQLGLLVNEVIKSEIIELDNTRVESALDDLAASYDDPGKLKDYYRHNQEARARLESMVLEEQVVDHILSKATVAEKQSSFEELMNSSN
ncbi:MAG: trigger factor [Proteobacteria bacterium]|nr:trigger factor [Pseudomonadota bacterium]